MTDIPCSASIVFFVTVMKTVEFRPRASCAWVPTLAILLWLFICPVWLGV